MKILFTPEWFAGNDVFIDFFSFIVLVSFLVLCVKCYRLSRKKGLLHLGSGFFLIALAQLALILTKLVLYYDTGFTHSVGQAVIASNVVSSVDIFYYLGLFFHKLFTMLGLFVIYKIPVKRFMKSDIIIVAYFILASSLLSVSFYYVFYLTVLMLSVMIISNYTEVYGKNRNPNTRLLIVGFLIFALSQLVFTFSRIGAVYVAASVIELIGFLVFFAVIVRISKAAKKA